MSRKLILYLLLILIIPQVLGNTSFFEGDYFITGQNPSSGGTQPEEDFIDKISDFVRASKGIFLIIILLIIILIVAIKGMISYFLRKGDNRFKR